MMFVTVHECFQNLHVHTLSCFILIPTHVKVNNNAPIPTVHSITSHPNLQFSAVRSPLPLLRTHYNTLPPLRCQETQHKNTLNTDKPNSRERNETETVERETAAMAASVSAWSKPGKWALDSEEHEEELLRQPPPPVEPPSTDFPSLSAAATTKTKKKKGQTLSLAEFSGYGSAKGSHYSAPTKTVFDDAALALPSGPRERTAEELDRSRIGGGFRSYGGGRGGEDSSARWGSGRASEEGRRPAGGRESGPSRADEADDWGATKKSTVGNGFERRDRERERGFFDSQSRSDDSESWISNKSSVSASSEGRRYGGGFERERRGGFEASNGGGGGGADADTWGRKREDSGPVTNSRPRLVLQPRTLPVSPVAVSPASPASSEKMESPVIVPKPKSSNPFGEARPREEVLAGKGQDWKEIDEKLENVKIKDPPPAEKVERGERLAFGGGRRSFGSGNGRANLPEERSWRKPETSEARHDDSRPQSVETVENDGVAATENGREGDM